MLVEFFNDALSLFRLLSTGEFCHFLLSLLLFFEEILDTTQPLFFKLLNFGITISFISLSLLVSFSLSHTLSLCLVFEALLDFLCFLLLSLFEDFYIRLELYVGCG